MSVATVAPVALAQETETWQYPGGEGWSAGTATTMVACLACMIREEQRVAEVLELTCLDGGVGHDLAVTLYIREDGREVWPEKVRLCHQGGGKFLLFGDLERVREVQGILHTVGLEE